MYINCSISVVKQNNLNLYQHSEKESNIKQITKQQRNITNIN